MSLGVGAYSPAGAGFDYGHDWAGRYTVENADLKTLNLAAGIAYRVTNRFDVGAALAAPARRVVLVAGDGGMLMTGLELVAAVRERVPVKPGADAGVGASARWLCRARAARLEDHRQEGRDR